MADRYLVNAPGYWYSTSRWSSSSGGSSGASIPTDTDNVIIDANSGTGLVTLTATTPTMPTGATGSTNIASGSFITIDYSACACANLTVTATQDITLGPGELSIWGSLSLPSTGSFKFWTQPYNDGLRNLMFFRAATGTFTIKTNGVPLPYNVLIGYPGTRSFDGGGIPVVSTNFAGPGATYSLLAGDAGNSDFNCLGTLSIRNGAFTTNNITLRVGSFTSSAAAGYTRVINLGSSTIIIRGAVNTYESDIGAFAYSTPGTYSITSSADLTLNSGTSVVVYKPGNSSSVTGNTDDFFTMFTNSSTK
jgi:hypothetical protein